ncbi:MAG TPA: tRNA 2-thiouridine(34) synthase MnmA [Acidimicrobiales bacterium]|nr:tRNA 2-thiouridine(34) synthase MnmA [Acidimicrobiales bacterium]HVC24145.1 tRNA 2-thiouridine(34) synthase MnmA [Acidimicrobiales bacterium]
MRILVAMSGGVDSSVAASLLVDAGHEVVGATMKLWGGPSDSGCCSAADVRDARRVCDHLGVDHHVFNFTDEFAAAVVDPYVADHAAGRTPNPCVECNRHLKFGALLERADRLGFAAVATGHHARVDRDPGSGRPRLLRGADAAKDQSYVLAALTAAELARVVLPIGRLTKPEVRALAERRGLATAAKPDSQDVCFVASRSPRAGQSAGRRAFLEARIDLHPGIALDAVTGEQVGEVPAIELVTVGQRRGLPGSGVARRFALAVDTVARTVVVGDAQDLLVSDVPLTGRTWVGEPLAAGTRCTVQVSAHGRPLPARSLDRGVRFDVPARRVAPGQLVACYVGDEVVGSGIAC